MEDTETILLTSGIFLLVVFIIACLKNDPTAIYAAVASASLLLIVAVTYLTSDLLELAE